MIRRVLLLSSLALLSGVASAQSELLGQGQYPQFRGLSGLPGGGFGVSPDGRLGWRGAMAFSSPVAYSLRPGRAAFAYGSVSRDEALRFGNNSGGDANVDANGTAVALYGVDLRAGWLTIGGMLFSGLYDSGINLHFTPSQGERDLQFGFGVQDIGGGGGTAGANFPTDDNSSASPYVVGTGRLRGDSYASLGIGAGRFHRPFGSVSAPIFNRARGVVEHDGYNINVFLAYSPSFGRYDEFGEEREGGATLTLGLTRGKYATAAIAIHF